MSRRISRRQYLKRAAAGGLGLTILGQGSARAYRANGKLNVAVIGAGMGVANTRNVATIGENIVAVCDVDRGKLDARWKEFPNAKRYVDFQRMLDRERLDAVMIATPDHWHAIMSVMAMRRGLHCFTQKPLTHSVHEARVMTEVAAETGVVTQLGTQMSAHTGCMRAVEWIQAGTIGPVREVHINSGRISWAQGISRPKYTDPVPKGLDWEQWVGPAPMRPYVQKHRDGPYTGRPVYHPGAWRGWWDFGTGKFGDQCGHQCNVAYWALDLGAPTTIKARASEPVIDAFPSWEIIEFQYPARGDRPAVKLIWYDGDGVPLPANLQDKLRPNCPLFVGDKGMLAVTHTPQLFPERAFADFQPPEPRDWGRTSVEEDWIRGIKEGTTPGCHFGHAGPMCEGLMLGNVALRVGKPIHWDADRFEITNCSEANEFVRRDYRNGWDLSKL